MTLLDVVNERLESLRIARHSFEQCVLSLGSTALVIGILIGAPQYAPAIVLLTIYVTGSVVRRAIIRPQRYDWPTWVYRAKLAWWAYRARRKASATARPA